MKILQLGKYYYPFRGGIETVVQNLAEGLHQSGHDVKVLCSNEKRMGDRISTGAQIDIIKTARYGEWFSQPLSPGMFFLMREYSKWADVMHFHTPNPLLELMALFIDKKCPWVVTYHADIVRQKMLMPFYRPVLRAFLEKVDKIIVPTINHIIFSPILREFQHKCQIVPFGIDPKNYHADQEINDSAARWKKSYENFFLFVGRLVSYKGLDVLMHAMTQVPDAKLLLVGYGPMREQLDFMVNSFNMRDRIHFLGHVEALELKGLLHACQGLLLPSTTAAENFGLVQLEAMACKKPVITTNLKSGVPLVGEHSKTCFIVEPSEPMPLARAINKLWSDPQKVAEMGLAGEKRLLEFFTIKHMIDGHLSLYYDLLRLQEKAMTPMARAA